MKHHPLATANAAALTVGVIYLVCALSVLLFPDMVLSIARTWFHGVTLSEFSNTSITPVSFLVGLFTSGAGGWAIGYVFAYFYNSFVKK